MKDFIKNFTTARSTGFIVNIILLVLVGFITYSIVHRISATESENVLSADAGNGEVSKSDTYTTQPLPFTNQFRNSYQYQVISKKNLFHSSRSAPESEESEEQEVVEEKVIDSAPDINLVGILMSGDVSRAYIREASKDNVYGPNDLIGETGFIVKEIHPKKIIIIPENDTREFEIYLKRYAGKEGSGSRMASTGQPKMYVKGDYSGKMGEIELKDINGKLRPLVNMNVRGRKYPRFLEQVTTPVFFENENGTMVPYTNMVINNKEIKVRVTEVPPSAFDALGNQLSGHSSSGSESDSSGLGSNNQSQDPRNLLNQGISGAESAGGVSGNEN